MKMNILRADHVRKYYGKEPVLIKALDGITLEVEEGSFTAIVGTSGSGKSTLLHLLGGLDTPENFKKPLIAPSLPFSAGGGLELYFRIII